MSGTSTPWPIPPGIDTIEIEGYPFAVRQQGSGPPLLLLHGSLGDYRSWDTQVPAFARYFRVIAPSLRHYYPEPWPGHGGDFSLARHADDVIALVARLDLDAVDIVGHSRGGAVALLVAMQRPDIVRSLVLAEPRGLEDLLPDNPENRRMAAESDAIFEALHRDLATGDAVLAARNFVEAFAGPGAWERRTDEQRQALLDNIRTGIDTGERPGLDSARVSEFQFPILPVVGETGAMRYKIGFAAMRDASSRISPVVSIPHAGHAMHRDNPDPFNDAVLGFLRGVDDERP